VSRQTYKHRNQTEAGDRRSHLVAPTLALHLVTAPGAGHSFAHLPVQAPQPMALQAKLTVNAPGDVYEQEAERVADQVMRAGDDRPQLQRAVTLRLQRCAACGGETPPGQPKCAACAAKDEDEHAQAREEPGATPEVTADTQAAIEAMRGGGQPLDPATRALLEPRFGHDFSQVRVHTDARAAATAQSVNALAFTVGRDIVFGGGQYQPGSNAGRRLLAHELTHVVQQGAADGNVQRQEDAPEAEAAVDLDPRMTELREAINVLQARMVEDDSPELAEHLQHLRFALTQIDQTKNNGTPAEQARISNYLSQTTQSPDASAAPGPAIQMKRVDAGATDVFEQQAEAIEAAAVDLLPNAAFQPITLRPNTTRSVQRFAMAAPAIGVGVAAGPPGWLVLAGVALAAAAVAVYVATRPTERTEEEAIPRDIAPPREETRPRTCESEYPQARRCEGLPPQFIHSSPQGAVNALKASMGNPRLRLVSPRPSTSGPCPGVGMHYGVKDGGTYIASISCCPCCRNTPAGPVMTTLCRII
jgi:hypothetical protein